jgi:hypothetical protein
MRRYPLFAVFLAALVSGCSVSGGSSVTPVSTSMSAGRELTVEEKKVIADSLSESIRDQAKAKYLWAPFPANVPANGQGHYCAAVNAKSPHAPYSGLQPYLVQVHVANGQIVSSVVGAIAGGADARIVRNLCAKHGLNPSDAV